jgi:hypothetical protein
VAEPNLYSNKLENLEVNGQFSNTLWSKIKPRYINNLTRSTTRNEVEAVIVSLPKKKSPGPAELTAEFNQTFKELIPALLTVFYEREM